VNNRSQSKHCHYCMDRSQSSQPKPALSKAKLAAKCESPKLKLPMNNSMRISRIGSTSSTFTPVSLFWQRRVRLFASHERLRGRSFRRGGSSRCHADDARSIAYSSRWRQKFWGVYCRRPARSHAHGAYQDSEVRDMPRKEVKAGA